MTGLVVVETSDLILALGIKFWAGIIEKENIKDLEECHHLINVLQDFLLVKSLDDKEEVKVKFLEKPDNEEEYQSSPATQEGDDDEDDDEDDGEDDGDGDGDGDGDSDHVKKAEVDDETSVPAEIDIEESGEMGEIIVAKKETEVRRKERKKLKKKYCDYCEATAPSVKTLSEHVSVRHSEKLAEFEMKQRRFPCRHCSARYCQEASLRSHLRKVHGAERLLSCQSCDKTFPTELRLRKHEAGHAGSFKCETCGREVAGRRRYLRHLERHRTGVCTVCGKTVARPSLLKHQETHCKASFQCQTCGREVSGGKKYLRHLQSHQAKPREDQNQKTEYKCGECGLVFGTLNLKQIHRYKAHNYHAFFCPVCGKKCYGSAVLNKHVGTHSESKEVCCDQCGRKFKSQFNLKRHQRVHQPDSEKRYKCSYSVDCTRAFSNSDSLHSHLNSHLGLKPYKCHLCETRFQNTSNRLAHLRNVHK